LNRMNEYYYWHHSYLVESHAYDRLT